MVADKNLFFFFFNYFFFLFFFFLFSFGGANGIQAEGFIHIQKENCIRLKTKIKLLRVCGTFIQQLKVRGGKYKHIKS